VRARRSRRDDTPERPSRGIDRRRGQVEQGWIKPGCQHKIRENDGEAILYRASIVAEAEMNKKVSSLNEKSSGRARPVVARPIQ
jgi:hypothetical protein